MTDYGQRVPGCSGSLDKVCYNAWPFEKPFSGARRTVIVDWDTSEQRPEHQRQTLHWQWGRTAMQIEKHDKSYIVKLEDGSSWRIWPGDIALKLGWSSMTVFEVSEIDDEFCSHALV
jgi:hypothetical protein